jgi:hypothetical protein
VPKNEYSEEYINKYMAKMKDDDDKFDIELENSIDELQEIFKIDDGNLHREFMNLCGSMQNYADRKAKIEVRLVRAKRFRDKLYNTRYVDLRENGGTALKSQHEYEVWISKDSNYVRMCSYCDTMKVLISHYSDTIQTFKHQCFMLQAIMKNREVETGPSFG